MASKTQLKTREKGLGTVFKDGKRFYLKIRASGKAKTKMLRNADGTACTTIDDAVKAADDIRPLLLAESKEELAFHLAEAKKIKRQSGLTLAMAWETFLKTNDRPDSGATTLEWYKRIFDLFLLWIENNHPAITRVAEVDQEIANEYFAHLWQSGISGSTYNSYLQAVKLVLAYLMEPAALDINPFDKIKNKTVETSSRKEFTEEQVSQIFEGFKTGFFYETTVGQLGPGRSRIKKKITLEFKPMFAEEMEVLLNLCCWTACRGQDGCLMAWDCVDFQNNRITYIPRKTARRTNRKQVSLPLHPDLKIALLRAQAWKNRNQPGENYIIPSVARRFRYNPSGVQKDAMKIIHCATGLQITDDNPKTRRMRAANLYSLHSFRHSFVSFCTNAGVSMDIVAEAVGHGNPAMTRHYSHINDKSKNEAIAALPRFSEKNPDETPLMRLNRIASTLDKDKLNAILKQLES